MRTRDFCRTFYRVGQPHRGPIAYQLARVGNREFWSLRDQREVFYSMEFRRNERLAILRRNTPFIEKALARLG